MYVMVWPRAFDMGLFWSTDNLVNSTGHSDGALSCAELRTVGIQKRMVHLCVVLQGAALALGSHGRPGTPSYCVSVSHPV